MIDSNIPKVTLEQWRAFQAVVEFGGYAQAAEQIHKTQSTLSYSVQKLENSLGVKVLEVKGRKARLTKAGEVLLRRSRQLLDSALLLEKVANSLARGVEGRIDVSVEVIFPQNDLLLLLAEFSSQFPETRVELVESVMSGGHELLETGAVDILVTGVAPRGFIGEPLVQLEFICVTSPDHPLQKLERQVTLDDLKQFRQMVTRDSGSQRKFDAPWLEAEQRWTVSNLSTSIKAIKLGLGFAWVPKLHIIEELSEGQLQALDMDVGGTRLIPLNLVYKDRDAAGPATCFFADLIRKYSRQIADRC